MTIRIALHHRTSYQYDRPVVMSPQVVRLRPAAHCRTPITSYSLTVEPKGHFCNWQQDPSGNFLARLVFPEPTDHFSVQVDLTAELVVFNPFDYFLEEGATTWPPAYPADLDAELALYRRPAPLTPLLSAYLKALPISAGTPTNDVLVAINQRLAKDVKYLIRMEPGVQTPDETLTTGSGSCRDSTWLLVNLLRHLGLAARFVSGYLVQLVADVKSLDGPSGTDKDFTDLHAWCEVYLPGAGWIGLDPTSGLMTGEGHLPLACSAAPSNAAPISGGFSFTKRDEDDEVDSEFDFAMTVTRLDDPPRSTKPMSDAAWAAALALGERIDRDLVAQDVRLTVGGEPTFVSIDDMEGEEWNTAALGERKRLLADELLKRLRDAFASGAFLHHGQGKWYPGEQLPRWALGCHWRKDGQPIWRNPALYADEKAPRGHTAADARRLLSALCARLGISDEHGMPGYEDAWYHLWRERRLPTNVDPLQSRLDDVVERERLAKIFDRGLADQVGWCLPLYHDGNGWVTGPWFLRREHLFLVPGDSPMGYRLPLDSLPWAPAGEHQRAVEHDPFMARGALPAAGAIRRQRPGEARDAIEAAALAEADGAAKAGPGSAAARAAAAPAPGKPAPWIVRTALCIEPRGGVLRVFMPPLAGAEDYLELVAAVEDATGLTGLQVLFEGYGVPRDPRLKSFAITPDPGVIEVNIHPAASWKELVATTERLYEEARLARLGTEKYQLDGRHSGTGGGNHITLGGATPADSPFLRRPDLLRSLVAYVHNHPALTYWFSSQFVGPTSQAPRPDEARHESTYELEKALSLIDEGGANLHPWQVDRLLRHLLIDVTGNTHRTQICIDKLFSPDSATGRLGLVELRAFEMPPHVRMALPQHLLLRGLVSSFWKQPYRQPLSRWGTAIHDRWLLPRFLEQDFADILADLRRAGYTFDPQWYEAQREFRFPLVGRVAYQGATLELRTAIEPWHVLGEEVTGTGTARYVDSSMERMQVLVSAFDEARYKVAVNGVEVPLHPTGTAGEYVCGVRFRAWQPPSALHPTVPVDAPLVVDLYDTWRGRAVAGCTYHVAHPGGLAHERFPVNSLEAESRRHARFQPFGHSPGPLELVVPPRNRDFPLTLDLRRDG